jgi:uncharacterized membrane protein
MSKQVLGSGETKLELIVSYLLIVGVVASVFFEVVGIALYFGAYGNVLVSQDKSVFISGEDFFAFFVQQVQHLFGAQNAVTFMALGIVVLMLTPFIRALTSVFYFSWEHNWKYVAITLFVFVVLTLSLALH